MAHALIINDNMAVSRAIEDRLTKLGFDSFDHSFTKGQALSVAMCRRPDLVVVGDTVVGASPSVVADHVFKTFGTPIVQMASGRCEVRRQVLQGEIVTGPFSLSDLGTAVAIACPGLEAVPEGAPQNANQRIMQAA